MTMRTYVWPSFASSVVNLASPGLRWSRLCGILGYRFLIGSSGLLRMSRSTIMMFLQVLQKQSELKSSPESSKDQIDSLNSVITDLNNSIKSVEKEIDRKQKDLKAAGKK